MHVVAPMPDCVPFGHTWQCVAGFESWSCVPALQFVHPPAALNEYVPGRHMLLLPSHGVDGSWSSSWYPLGQCVHVTASSGEKNPIGQRTHGVLAEGNTVAVSLSYCPFGHAVHVVAPPPAYLPDAHTVHGVDGPSRSA